MSKSKTKKRPYMMVSDFDIPEFLAKFENERTTVVDLKQVVFHGVEQDLLPIVEAINEAVHNGVFSYGFYNHDKCPDCRDGELHLQINMIPHRKTAIQ